jgi:hypothetical protein
MSPFGPDPAGVSALAGLLAGFQPQIQNQWFHCQKVTLDGYRWVQCRFDQCEVTIAKGTFQLEGCYFSGCTFLWLNEAGKAVRLHNLYVPEAITRWPGLVPIYNADGTISIT